METVYLCTATVLLLIFSPTISSATTIGVTYNPSNPKIPPPERVVSALLSLRITSVRLLDPTPAAVRAFADTNISLLLSVPNLLIPSFAANRSAAAAWLYSHVFPYHPHTRISLISAGSDVHNTVGGSSDPSTSILPAVRNIRLALLDLGIRTIPVSTTFSFVHILASLIQPSAPEFQEPIASLVIRPLLQFLSETNSSFLVNLYPYRVYRRSSLIPIGFALFQEHPFNFRDDVITGVRYWNLFDMMVDAVIAAIAVSGKENIPLVVTETGWPSDGEAHAAGNYAEMYLQGLVTHLRSGLGTPLRKEGVAEVYIYQMFDDGDLSNASTTVAGKAAVGEGQRWGIMYNNMSMKYNKLFGSIHVVGEGGLVKAIVAAAGIAVLVAAAAAAYLASL